MMRRGSTRLLRGMHFREGVQRAYSDVLTADVIDTLHALAPYDTLIKQAMQVRAERRASRFAAKKRLTFLPPDHIIPYVGLTAEAARKGAFTSSVIPKDLECQWVQGTGPAARPGEPLARNLRGVAYALLSGADGWMFDGEDAMGQAGTQSLEAQRSLRAALAGTPQFMDVAQDIAKDITKWAASFFSDGKGQVPPEKVAEQLQFTTRIFRPRGLHLDDRHVRSPTGAGFSASLVDVVLYCVHNAQLLLSQGRSVVLYLPKIQTAGEAALWGEILSAVERHLGLPQWAIKTYVLVEQVEAAFQLLEIRAALGERFIGFNTGRWDYIHSVVDAMAWDPDFANPDISAITMRYPYMAAYERRVFRAANTPDSKGRCSLWQGGMEQQIPVGSAAAIKAALAAAVAGAERERDAGASGKWVAHWKMVHVVRPVWASLGQPNLSGRAAGELTHTAADAAALLQAPSSKDVVRRTARGARELVSVALQYGAAALAGLQSVALKAAEDIGSDSVLALMEDMATAEIRVGILWEWVAKGAAVTDGASSPKPFTAADFEAVLAAELTALKEALERDPKATQPLPLLEASAAAIRAAVLSAVKAPWYCDVLNCSLGASSPDEVRARVTSFFDALRTRGVRTTEPLDFAQPPRVDRFQKAIAEAAAFFALPRFRGQTRLHTARDVAEQQGTLIGYSSPTADSLGSPYPTAAAAAESMWSLLRRLAAQRSSVTTFGPYSPSQVVCMARAGIQGTYLGGWATSAKGDADEDPGPDLASYPLSRVPKEAAALVRAMVTADRNQMYSLARGQGGAGQNGAVVDFMPRIIADADTGHGGDAHVRNLVRRFTEVGVAGCHIEDQKPGVKKCGHQGGKVLVPVDEFIRRLAAARLQYDIMRVPGIIVARTDAEAATLLDGKGDERDMPYVLGATNLAIPTYRAAFVAMLKQAYTQGVTSLSGHKIFSLYDSDTTRAAEWLESSGLSEAVRAFAADALAKGWGSQGGAGLDAAFDTLFNKFADKWAADAQMRTFPEALAAQVAFTEQQGEEVPKRLREVVASLATDKVEMDDVRAAMRDGGIDVPWSADHARTPDGYFQIRGGIPYAVTRAVAVAPFCDVIWMETKTADLHEAREFADAVHAKCPGKLLAYNLSPSFNWDTTGMSEEEMADFPKALGRLGFVFNFITYGGHQVDGAAAEDFSASLRRDGMLALARLQRKLRLVESPYRTPQSLVGGPRADSALTALTGRTSSTKAMGKGSTQFQHLIATELSPKLLDDWLAVWVRAHSLPAALPLRTALRPHVSIGSLGGSELLELSIAPVTPTPTTASEAHDPPPVQVAALASVVFALIKDRRGHVVLSVRDQTTVPEMRRKRLMALCLLFLLRRYHVDRVNFVTPTPDNRAQAQRMLEYGFFTSMREEVGEIIRCNVARDNVEKMCAARGEVAAFIGGAMPSCAAKK